MWFDFIKKDGVCVMDNPNKKRINNFCFNFLFVLLVFSFLFDAYKAFVIYNPFAYSLFTFFDVFVFFLIFLYILYDLFLAKLQIKSSIAFLCILLCFCIGISSLIHCQPNIRIVKEGLWLICGLYFLALSDYKEQRIKFCCISLIVLSFLVVLIPSLVVILCKINVEFEAFGTLFKFGFSADDRLMLFYFHPNHIASSCIVFLAAILIYSANFHLKLGKILSAICICFILSVLSLTNSRTSLICCVLLLALVLTDKVVFSDLSKIRRTIYAFASIIILCMVLVLVLYSRLLLAGFYYRQIGTVVPKINSGEFYNLADFKSDDYQNAVLESRFFDLGDRTFNNRTAIWKDSIEEIIKHPVFGQGAYNRNDNVDTLLEYYNYNTHNAILKIALNYGLPALICSCCIIFFIVIKSIAKLPHLNTQFRYAFYSLFVILLYCLLEDGIVEYTEISVMFFILIGMLQSQMDLGSHVMNEARYAINGRSYGRRLTGQERLCREIVNCMDFYVLKGEYVLYIPSNAFDVPEFKNINIVKSKLGCFSLWDQFSYQWDCYRFDLIPISFTPIFPIFIKGYVTIHDTCYNTEKQFFRSFRNRISRIYHLFFQFIAMHNSYGVFTVSDFSNQQLRKIYKHSLTPVVTITSGWEHVKRLNPSKEILEKYSLKPYSYFFSMASNAPNKNFKWVLRTASLNPNERFIISGKKVEELIVESQLENVAFLGYVSDDEMATLMKYCKAFIFPSTYEGFGLPPLETLYWHRPIILSDIPCFKEIYNGVAAFINPQTPVSNINDYVHEPNSVLLHNILKKHSFDYATRIILKEIGAR